MRGGYTKPVSLSWPYSRFRLHNLLSNTRNFSPFRGLGVSVFGFPQTGNTAPIDGSASKTVVTLFHKYDVANENNRHIGGLADALSLDSDKQYALQTC